MKIKLAKLENINQVHSIVITTILIIYPNYYPKCAVEFFINFHNKENIKKDIQSGKVYICINEKGLPIGTVTIDGNEIKRLFVLPEF